VVVNRSLKGKVTIEFQPIPHGESGVISANWASGLVSASV
jgi:hypothetical protein